MKRLILLVIISCFSIAAHAVDLLDGYIVLSNNDTIKCKIKGGRFLNVPFQGVTIVNEQGEEQALRAKDNKIIAFGFLEKLRRYHYMYIEAGDKSDSGFYQLLNRGPRYRLYFRPPAISGENPSYVLFTPTGEFKKFEPCVLCPWRKQLRELLKEDSKALELVETAPRINIPQFVIDLNKA